MHEHTEMHTISIRITCLHLEAFLVPNNTGNTSSCDFARNAVLFDELGEILSRNSTR